MGEEDDGKPVELLDARVQAHPLHQVGHHTEIDARIRQRIEEAGLILLPLRRKRHIHLVDPFPFDHLLDIFERAQHLQIPRPLGGGSLPGGGSLLRNMAYDLEP